MDDAVDESMKRLPESISPADEEGKNDYIKELQKLEKEIMLAKQKVLSDSYQIYRFGKQDE
ncbi:hypothetical protein [Escherichia coli]|uniref:hypothetical protein n=1 Tax=Escherichia coli TaxID=562 RepID=UPI00207CC235|nr:hypothetical protein [Escherichia coli]